MPSSTNTLPAGVDLLDPAAGRAASHASSARARRTTPRTRPRAWVYSLVFHLALLGLAAALVPIVRATVPDRDVPVDIVMRTPEPSHAAVPRLHPTAVPEIAAPHMSFTPTNAPDPVFDDEPLADADARARVVIESQPHSLTVATLRPERFCATKLVPAAPAAPAAPPVGETRQARLHAPLAPVYPDALRRQNIEGVTVLDVSLDAAGRVISIMVVEGDPNGAFAVAAQEAVRRARYLPALKNGVSVPGRMIVRVAFKLK